MVSRADTHVHSKYSGLARLGFLRFPESTNEPGDIVKKAKAAGLDTVCVTDHNTIKGGVMAERFARTFDGIDVVVGEEISCIEGEVIGLYLNEDVPKDLPVAEAVDRVRSQGGLLIAPHPFSMHVPGLRFKVDELDLDGLEVFNAGHTDGYANKRALEHARCGRWAMTGGSDSHSLSTIGCAYTEFEGSGGEDLRKAILNKTTSGKGEKMSIEAGTRWTMEVVMEADRQIIRSVIGRNGEDPDNLVTQTVNRLPGHKKLLALIGSAVYLMPPIPYLVVWIGEKRIKRLNSVPIHDPNAHDPGLF